jgi:hypothetical protein
MRGIGEIRLKVDKQYRILGFFGPDRSDFTLARCIDGSPASPMRGNTMENDFWNELASLVDHLDGLPKEQHGAAVTAFLRIAKHEKLIPEETTRLETEDEYHRKIVICLMSILVGGPDQLPPAGDHQV